MAVPALPCKNLTAAHIACPNARNSYSGGVYCDSCRDTIQPTGARVCRNAASRYLTLDSMGSHVGCPHGGQSGKHGFCKSCTGQAALPLCLNYTNGRVRCGNALEVGADRNEVFCKTCQSALTVPNKKERLCKNAAAGDNPCSNASNDNLLNEYHGMCLSCGAAQKALLANVSEDPSLCRSAGCLRPFELPLSRYCRECILKQPRSADLVIDVREKDLVLEMETEAASEKCQLCKRSV